MRLFEACLKGRTAARFEVVLALFGLCALTVAASGANAAVFTETFDSGSATFTAGDPYWTTDNKGVIVTWERFRP